MQVLDYDGTDHLVDKIYDLINSGGSADYIVEEGTSGIWTYRKWASGIAECWGAKYNGSTAVTNAWGNLYEGAVTEGIAFPSGLFIEAPKLYMTLTGMASLLETTNGVSATYTPKVWAVRPTSATGAVVVHFHAKGLWKAFTPSVSAKAQVGFEDLTSQVISGTSMYTISTDDTRAYRIGNLLFMNVRGIVNTAQTQAINIPWVKVPISIHANLTGIVTINGSPTYPVVRVGTVNGAQYLYQAITSNISANSSLWFSFIAVIKPT